MISVADFIDEFCNGSLSNVIGDDPIEECIDYEDCEKYLLSYDKEEHVERKKRGTTTCTYSAENYLHFLCFYNYLLRNGYETMKLRDENRYKVDVYGLTPEDATELTKKFLAMRKLVSQRSRGKVA